MGQCLCVRRRARVIEPPVKLPCELEEEILSHLPLKSLVRFRSVCKQWNSLFKDKRFLNNHLSRSRPQLILVANSKVYSIDIIGIDYNRIHPKIELLELPSSDFLYDDEMVYTSITTCDELLFCNYQDWKNGTALWNPWLRQYKSMKYPEYKYRTFFYISGLGYDNSRPEKVYKILGYFLRRDQIFNQRRVAIYEYASHTFTFLDTPEEAQQPNVSMNGNVSLNGNLYWVHCNVDNHDYCIRSFDFSTEKFKPFCLLPCKKKNLLDELILAVYKGDRFSLLKQCYATGKIEIWVTKKSIGREEEEVAWTKLMTLPTTNLPNLPRLFRKYHRISYLIYDKTMFLCCDDDNETGAACIYVVREDLCKKIQIDSRIVECCHCIYTPNLISLPSFS